MLICDQRENKKVTTPVTTPASSKLVGVKLGVTTTNSIPQNSDLSTKKSSTTKEGYASGYGDAVVKLSIPAEKLVDCMLLLCRRPTLSSGKNLLLGLIIKNKKRERFGYKPICSLFFA